MKVHSIRRSDERWDRLGAGRRTVASVLLSLALIAAACAGGSDDVVDDGPADEAQEADSEAEDTDAGEDATADDELAEDVEPVTLRGVSAFGVDDRLSELLHTFADYVEEISDGSLTIEIAGGPEVVDPFDLGESTGSGAVDLAWISAAYYLPSVPEAAMLNFSELNPEEEREAGALEYLNEIQHDKMNAHVLGRTSVGLDYSLYTTTAIEELSDFEGLRIRVSPVYVSFVQELGAEPVTLPGGEIYTALERGAVDGFAWPSITAALDLSLHEVVDYRIDPPFWQGDQIALINLGVWEDLHGSQQDALTEAVRRIETESPAFYASILGEEEALYEEAGVETIELSGDEAEAYLGAAREGARSWVRENVSEDPERLLELFGLGDD